ncbi:large ribosomal subunit protein P1-like [Halichondria panicea]|uniref:large ribosomal subunit protein P1-like n=1 Tax=Halichondria panicea TaxID=6063 RepID=UPI00312B9F96
MSESELACVYSALILQDADINITAEKMTTLIKAAGLDVEPIWPSLFSKALEGKDVGALIMNVGSGAAAAAPAAGMAAGGDKGGEKVEEKKEEKKPESEDESDDDMGFGLFD